MKIYFLIMCLIVNIVYLVGNFLSDLKVLQLEEYSTLKFVKYKIKYCKFDIFLCVISLILFMGKVIFNGIWLLNVMCPFLVFFFLCCLFKTINVLSGNICLRFTKRIYRIILLYLFMTISLIIMSYSINIMSHIMILLPIILLFLTISVNIIVFTYELILANFYSKMASKKLKKLEIKKIAITGSYGKTSVKSILDTILKEKYCVISSPKSYNTINGFSLTVRNGDFSKCDVMIMEMGAKRKGDIRKLCKLYNPQYGILTAIEKQHLETFKTIDLIIETKKELQDNLSENSFMVFNCNNKNVKELCENYNGDKFSVASNVVGYGDISAMDIDIDNGCRFDIYYGGKFFCRAKCELVGGHHVENILLAVAMAIKLGLNSRQIESGISKLKPVQSRMQPINISNNCVVINNGYNSNPSSARASLKLIGLYNLRKVVVACGFVEMSKEQYVLNKELGSSIAKVADAVYVVNKINRKALLDGLQAAGYDKELKVVNKFKDIDFKQFKDSVILIENDLPDNYI